MYVELPISCFAHNQQVAITCVIASALTAVVFEIAQTLHLFQDCTTQSMTNNKKPKDPELTRFKVLYACASRRLIFNLGWYASVIGVRMWA